MITLLDHFYWTTNHYKHAGTMLAPDIAARHTILAQLPCLPAVAAVHTVCPFPPQTLKLKTYCKDSQPKIQFKDSTKDLLRRCIHESNMLRYSRKLAQL